MQGLLDQILAARRVSAPFVLVRTPDQPATLRSILGSLTNDASESPPPAFVWDIARGGQPINEAGRQALVDVGLDPSDLLALPDCLDRAVRLPARSVLFILNAQFYVTSARSTDVAAVVQGVANLREPFKGDERTLILLAPDLVLPPELADDFVVVDEPRPDADVLGRIATTLYRSTFETDIAPALLDGVVLGTRGLSAFGAEQVMAMALTEGGGVDLDALWERKRQQINDTPGLTVYRGTETWRDMIGYEALVDDARAILQGKLPVGAGVLLDEIEKSFAGAIGSGGDTSGTSRDQLGVVLRYMEDVQAQGIILIGPPGCAKTLFARCFAGEAGVPLIEWDIGAAKGSLVGQTEERTRRGRSVIDAVSAGKPFFIATCNKIADLPPELRRRFTAGTYFCDLPTADERAGMRAYYADKYELDPTVVYDATGWTGAEIRNCARMAWARNMDPREAAKRIVPIYKSAADMVQRLRQEASGRYLSASHVGPYEYRDTATDTVAKPSGRRVAFASPGGK